MIFWIIILSAIALAIVISTLLGRVMLRRIAAGSDAPSAVIRGGTIAARIAILPSLLLGPAVGGNLGVVMIKPVLDGLPPAAWQTAVWAGLAGGCGTLAVYLIVTLTMAYAGAVFMKFYLAR